MFKIEINNIYNIDCKEGLQSIADESIDAIITDPPYNTHIKGNRMNKRVKMKNFFDDSFESLEYESLVNFCSKEFFRVLKNNKPLYLFINWKSYPLWYFYLEKAGFKLKNCIVWDKEVHGLNYQNYAYRHEFLIFATKGDFFPLKKETEIYRTDIWCYRRDLFRDNTNKHATEKPLFLCRKIIEHATLKHDVILDPFVGGGNIILSALVKCRNYIGFEIEKTFYDYALNKIKNYDRWWF